MWEDFINWWNSFSNNNLVSILTGVAGFASVGLFLLSKTAIGKKGLNKLTDFYVDVVNRLKKEFADFKKNVDNKLDTYESNEKQFEDDTSKKVVAVYIQFESFKDDVFKVLEQIPNAKVQDAVKELKETTVEKENQIKALLGDVYNEINSKRLEKQDESIEKLNKRIEFLEEFIARLHSVEQEGENDGGNE